MDFPTLRRLAHQIKGSAGGYGFHPIGDAAGRLEYELLGDQADQPTINQRVQDLVSCCLAAVRPEIN
jgi:chemotaxis protein histidine kinase CheA